MALKKNGGGHGSAEESARCVNFEVIPFASGSQREPYFMVVFEDGHEEAPARPAPKKGGKELEYSRRQVAKLEQELLATREHLQAVIETHEATNEELQSANEEILSSNEELQSTNEELETAKEELQSTNEELTTVNDELRNRNQEVNLINNDLTNVLASIDIAVVLVGNDLTLRRFTQRAQELFSLIPADVGRPLSNINPTLELPELLKVVAQVVSNSRSIERTVTDRKGNRFQLRVLPYRTAENKVEGAVITLVDVSGQGASAAP